MKVLAVILLFISTITQAKPIRVMVVDTGTDISNPNIRKHVNISNWTKEDYIDLNSHGTHISGIILDGVCDQVELISCKFYDLTEDESLRFQKTLNCFKKALKEHVDIVNYSAGGKGSNQEEYDVLRKLSNANIKIIVAAGNDGQDLLDFNYYPAKYSLKNLIVVGNLEQNGRRNITSNYNLNKMVWEVGTKIWSTLPHNSFGYMTGTSQATAKRTNRILRKMCSNE